MQAGSAAGSNMAARCLPENSGAEQQDELRGCGLSSLSDEEANVGTSQVPGGGGLQRSTGDRLHAMTTGFVCLKKKRC
jgi:hypothetical protein